MELIKTPFNLSPKTVKINFSLGEASKMPKKERKKERKNFKTLKDFAAGRPSCSECKSCQFCRIFFGRILKMGGRGNSLSWVARWPGIWPKNTLPATSMRWRQIHDQILADVTHHHSDDFEEVVAMRWYAHLIDSVAPEKRPTKEAILERLYQDYMKRQNNETQQPAQ